MKRCILPCFVALFFASACGSDSDSSPDATPTLSQECMDASDHSDLAWIQTEIFDKSCAAFSVCHQGAASSAGGLTLENGLSEMALVNVDSTRVDDWKLVVPGDPDNSYLMVLLGGVEGPLVENIGTMPFNNPLLCRPKIDAVGRWIEGLQ